MSDGSSDRKREEHTESPFSKDEAPSYCSRPTPLRPPPSDELRDFGSERLGTQPSNGGVPSTPSSRPTVVPNELPSLPYTASAAPPDTAKVVRESQVEPPIALMPIPRPPSPAVITIEPPPRRRGSARATIAWGLFVFGFGWMLGIAGYVFRPRLGVALHELQVRLPLLAATR
ncbi:MAG TPA: hypothetical protein VER96_00980 [Polyangiaceae bacterium]|nr:hypothetical protein [Polyangiaceae bacterium]